MSLRGVREKIRKNKWYLEVETGEGKTLDTLGAEDLDDLGSFVKDGTTDDTITEDLTDSLRKEIRHMALFIFV